MTILCLCQVLSLIFLYYGLIGILPVILPVNILVLTAIGSVVGIWIASVWRGKPFARVAGGILCLLPLLGCRFGADLLFGLPPAVYTIYLILTDRLQPEVWSFQALVKISFPASALAFVLSFGSLQDAAAVDACLFLHFIFGVFFLRQYRMGTAMHGKNRIGDFGLVLLIPSVAAVLALFIAGLFRGFSYVFQLLLAPFAFLFSLFISLLSALTPEQGFEDPTPATIPVESVPAESEPAVTMPPSVGSELPFDVPDNLWQSVLVIAAAVGCILLLIWFVRFLSRQTTGGLRSTDAPVGSMSDLEEPDPQTTVSGRKRLRRVYEKYLAFLRSSGYVRSKSDTSSDVCEAGTFLSEDSANEDLRQIYIRGRYNTAHEVSGSEVRSMQELYRKIKKSTRNMSGR